MPYSRKQIINRFCSKFGFEVHGVSYMQSLRKTSIVPDVFQVQKELLNGHAEVIFDLGANYGIVTREYKELFPDAHVYGFEPFPSVFEALTKSTSHLKNVHLHEKAVTKSSGKRTFYVNENFDTNSLLMSQKTGLSSDTVAKNKTSIEVDAISLDEFCDQHKISEIDILKMDIQGGELDALKGAEKLLKEKRIKLIYSEAFFIPQYSEQPLFHDLSIYLDSVGYQIQDLYNLFYGKGSLAWCDAVFLPRKTS